MTAPALAQVHDNPGYDRPGLGFTPAVLLPGDATLEQGVPDWSHARGASVYDADTLLRLGLGHALELQLGSGWNWLDAHGSVLNGRPDTALAVKFAPAAIGGFSWGLLGSVEFTDGAWAFRNEQRQYLFGASFNWQRDPGHALGLYAEARGGQQESQLVAINSSWTITPTLGWYAEAAAQRLAGVGGGSMAGAGLSWQVTPRVQLDIGARHRLFGHADTWEGGLGFAVYFGN
ncbi:MAG: transporter [Rhodanobacteraceae bacterium]